MVNKRPLRVAQIAPLWAKVPPDTYGGIELSINLLIENLIQRGHEVTLFASADCQTSARLHAVCDENLLAMMAKGNAYSGDYYINAGVAEAVQLAGDFDLLHFHTGVQTLPFAAHLPKALFTLHTALSLDDLWTLNRYQKAKTVGISGYQVRELPSPPLSIIYNGCDFDRFSPSYEPGTYLAFLGRMAPEKNPLGAIALAKQIGMPLVMAGMPQGGKEQVYFDAHVLPLIDGVQVRHLGAVGHEAKNALLRGAAALLFPIQWAEPFGLVMIEAMACGTPVLAVRLGSVSEVVDEGVTGLSAESMEGLLPLFERVLKLNREQVRELGRSRFHVARMMDDYEALYQRMNC